MGEGLRLATCKNKNCRKRAKTIYAVNTKGKIIKGVMCEFCGMIIFNKPINLSTYKIVVSRLRIGFKSEVTYESRKT